LQPGDIRVYDAVYRYAQHHGTIKWTDEKRFTLSGSMSIPGGNWDHRKDFDCTISVEASKDGRKSVVDVVETFPARQQSLAGMFSPWRFAHWYQVSANRIIYFTQLI
jgi:hypothetical protein